MKNSDFKYLGVTLSTKNDWSKEIRIRINKAQRTFSALTKCHVQNVIKEDESKTIRSHYETDANIWLRSLDDNQTNREKTEDF